MTFTSGNAIGAKTPYLERKKSTSRFPRGSESDMCTNPTDPRYQNRRRRSFSFRNSGAMRSSPSRKSRDIGPPIIRAIDDRLTPVAPRPSSCVNVDAPDALCCARCMQKHHEPLFVWLLNSFFLRVRHSFVPLLCALLVLFGANCTLTASDLRYSHPDTSIIQICDKPLDVPHEVNLWGYVVVVRKPISGWPSCVNRPGYRRVSV